MEFMKDALGAKIIARREGVQLPRDGERECSLGKPIYIYVNDDPWHK